MECDICKVQTEKGDCVLHSVKARGFAVRKLALPLENKSQAAKLLGCVFYCRFQGHQIEVKSKGGHFTGVGTIHGNVDISLREDSVRTASRGQQSS